MRSASPKQRVAIVGAGISGLVAALLIARQGAFVEVFERAADVGGKMRVIEVGGANLDVGPTVFTMRTIFEDIFASVGADFGKHVVLRPLEVLARHAWNDQERLDLYADRNRSADAIAAFSSATEAKRFLRFSDRARDIYQTLDRSFIRAQRVSGPVELAQRIGLHRWTHLARLQPFTTLWQALGTQFHDARLRQLFARYATYCGSSPLLAPATLMLVAHVEQEGVWSIEGGMHSLARALQRLAKQNGAAFRFGAEVTNVEAQGGAVRSITLASGERCEIDALVMTGDVEAAAAGRFGAAAAAAIPAAPSGARSLSAITWAMTSRVKDFPLARHNVFFSHDYELEFTDVFKHHRVPLNPTVYVCAQDRNDGQVASRSGERLFALINAPANGDSHRYALPEIRACQKRAFGVLARCGLDIEPPDGASVVTTPTDFERLFPGSGGALYGRASHGWRSSFERPGARTRLRNLYLAGASTHPGPGVPMVAVSGQLAALALLQDMSRKTR